MFFRPANSSNPAPIQPPFPNEARIESRLTSDNPLFDAFLLEVFAKQGVRQMITILHLRSLKPGFFSYSPALQSVFKKIDSKNMAKIYLRAPV